MSIVTSVLLTLSIFETVAAGKGGLLGSHQTPALVHIVNAWLVDHELEPLQLHCLDPECNDCGPGIRHARTSIRPYICAASGAYSNWITRDEEEVSEFVEMVLALPWRYPEQTILVLTHEDSATMIYRPSEFMPEIKPDPSKGLISGRQGFFSGSGNCGRELLKCASHDIAQSLR